MYSVLSTKRYIDQIRKALGAEDIVYEEVGEFDSTGIVDILQAAARVNSLVLILDLDVAPGPDLTKAIKQFRFSRPQTRIILIAPGRTPGDRVITSLVKTGIYDILAPEVEDDIEPIIVPYLVEMINKPPANYSQAFRWDLGEEDETQNKKVVREIQEREKIKTENLRVAVAGVRRGAGTTHTAIAVAIFLAKQKKRVAFLEMTENPVLEMLVDNEFKGPFFLYNGVDFWFKKKNEKEGDKDLFFQAYRKGYNYIVTDLGTLEGELELDKSYKWENLVLSDVSILVSGISLWHIKNLEKYALKLRWEKLSKFKIYLTQASSEMIRNIKDYFSSSKNEVYAAPLLSDAFDLSTEQTELFSQMLESIIEKTTTVEKKKKWFLF